MEHISSSTDDLLQVFSRKMSKSQLYHPITTFNLLKNLYSSKILEEAASGIVDIQEYFEFDPLILARGNIIDQENGQKYISASELKSSDLFNIAKEARKAYNYEGAVKWLKAL